MIKTYKPNDTARIEAMLFTLEHLEDAKNWAGVYLTFSVDNNRWRVLTLEGRVDLPFGHYLIKGTNGEFYPCDPDVFRNRWMEVDTHE